MLSAMPVVLSVMFVFGCASGCEGACVDVKPSCSERGPVDLGIYMIVKMS